jgi:hypothetical protein
MDQIFSQLGYHDLLMWQSTLDIYEPSTNNPFSSSITSQSRRIFFLPYNHNQQDTNKDKSHTTVTLKIDLKLVPHNFLQNPKIMPKAPIN